MNKILITGGGGYLGSVLTKKLLELGHYVRVLDLFMYDKEPFREIDEQKAIGKLDIFRGDIRDTRLHDFVLDGIETVIHLACISNDPGCDLDPKLARSINLDSFEPFVKASTKSGVRRFINASSSSVYGVSDEPNVVESTLCQPLTDYSKYKLANEITLTLYEDSNFTTTSVRSATICGYSPRQRLDVIVNILTNHAYNLGKITVTGGPQKRPNVHIEDIADFYIKLINAPAQAITGQVFNYGADNFTVDELATLVQKNVQNYSGRDVKIIKKETNDPRSYKISSDKAWLVLGVKPTRSLDQAVQDLCSAFSRGLLPDSLIKTNYFNIERMKEIKLK